MPLAELSGRVATSFCGFAVRCGYAAELEQYFLHTALTDCASEVGALFSDTTFAQYQRAIDAGTLVYHADLAAECLAAFDGADCDPTLFDGTPPGCQQTFEGRVPDGGSCTISEECGEASVCTSSGTACGTCVRRPQIGESCSASGVSCGSGAFCSAGTCAASAGLGGACDPSASESPCVGNLACVPGADPTRGTCATPPTVGVGQDCLAAPCASGLVCAPTSTSAACRTPRTDGTCEALLQGTDCRTGTVCDASMSASTLGHCVPYPAIGAPCTTTCAAPGRCVSSVCQPSRRLGEPCTIPDECVSGACASGVCVAPSLCTP